MVTQFNNPTYYFDGNNFVPAKTLNHFDGATWMQFWAARPDNVTTLSATAQQKEGVTGVANHEKIELKWDQVESNDGGEVASYNFERKPEGGTYSSLFTYTNPENFSYNPGAQETAYDENPIDDLAPNLPSGWSISYDSVNRTITVGWTDPGDNGVVNYYRVKAEDDNGNLSAQWDIASDEYISGLAKIRFTLERQSNSDSNIYDRNDGYGSKTIDSSTFPNNFDNQEPSFTNPAIDSANEQKESDGYATVPITWDDLIDNASTIEITAYEAEDEEGNLNSEQASAGTVNCESGISEIQIRYTSCATGSTTNYPASISDGTQAYQDTNASTGSGNVDITLPDQQRHYISIFAKDGAGNIEQVDIGYIEIGDYTEPASVTTLSATAV